jgi:uncharacterized protein YdeI (BOF family)
MILILSQLSVLMFSTDVEAATKSLVLDLLKQPSQGQNVMVEGRFVRAVNYETLLFRDPTGQIEVLLDEDNSFPDRLLDPAYLILLKGETGSGYNEAPVIHFESVEIISHDPAHAAVKQIVVSNKQKEQKREAYVAECDDVLSYRFADTAHNIKQLKRYRCFGEPVSLIGSFVEQVNYETLLFSDQTGEIEVIFEEDDMGLLNDRDWQKPVKVHGELVEGYQGSPVLLFEDMEKLPVK